MGWVGTFPYCSIDAVVALANTFITLHNCHLFFVLRTVKIASLRSFEVYKTVLLTVITVLCISHFIGKKIFSRRSYSLPSGVFHCYERGPGGLG